MRPARLTRRPMTDPERAALRPAGFSFGECIGVLIAPVLLAAVTAFLFFVIPVALFGLLNALVGWLPRAFLKPYTHELRIAALVWVAFWCAIVWVPGIIAAARARGAAGPISDDLAAGEVEVREFDIAECLCVTDDEHGGLGYFLRTADHGVLFVIDDESGCEDDLGWGYRQHGRDPRQARFLPGRRWLVASAPRSGRVVSAQFTGDRVEPRPGIFVLSVASEFPDVAAGQAVPLTWAEVLARYATLERTFRAPPALCSECEYDLTIIAPGAGGQVICPECGQGHSLEPDKPRTPAAQPAAA